MKNLKLNRFRLVGVGLGAIGVVAVGGAAFAQPSAPAVTANATDVVISTTSSHALSPAGGVTTTVLTATVPAGKWVVSASGDLVDYGPSDYTRCKIVAGATQIAAVSTIVGDPASAGNNGPAAFLSPFALTGGVSLKAASTVTVQCWHDSTVSSSGYVDPNATLTLHRSNSLQIATES